MKHFIHEDVQLYQIYDKLSKNEYTFLLGHIKNFSMMQYLYGKESCSHVLKDMDTIFDEALESHDYVCRLHDDLYVLFIKSQDPYRIIQYIYQIDQIIEHHDFKQIKHIISMAYGVYFLRHDADFYQAYDKANFAMLHSKDLNKYNTTFEFYDQKEDALAKKQFAMLSDLENALKTHEFEVYLQAKVDAITHEVKGCEALLRWVHQGNEIPLRDFMPLIDKNAFIRRIDLFVFEEVCALLAKWQQKGWHVIPISVNISRASFEDGFYYLKEIEAILKRFPIDKQLLEFELSEGICFEDNHRLHRFLNLMMEHGFRCSLDDFGSGYSSFYALTYLPIQTVKLDASFSIGPWNEKRTAILVSLLELLHTLSFEIVVEGVESAEAAAFFQSHPCHLLQGFYFSKPIPIDAFEERYKEELI